MTDADILTILKTDLMVSSSALDTYLQTLIASAKDYISTEGITLADSQSDGMLVEMYAAYLYRRRREENGSDAQNVTLGTEQPPVFRKGCGKWIA